MFLSTSEWITVGSRKLKHTIFHYFLRFSRLIDCFLLNWLINHSETYFCCIHVCVCPMFLGPMVFILRCWHGVKFTGVFVCPNRTQMFVFLTFLSLHLSPSLFLSLSQPKGRAGDRVCCFSAGGGDEMRRTVTRGACLSDIHPLALPPTHWRSDTRTLPHKHILTKKKKEKRHTLLQIDNKPTQN